MKLSPKIKLPKCTKCGELSVQRPTLNVTDPNETSRQTSITRPKPARRETKAKSLF